MRTFIAVAALLAASGASAAQPLLRDQLGCRPRRRHSHKCAAARVGPATEANSALLNKSQIKRRKRWSKRLKKRASSLFCRNQGTATISSSLSVEKITRGSSSPECGPQSNSDRTTILARASFLFGQICCRRSNTPNLVRLFFRAIATESIYEPGVQR